MSYLAIIKKNNVATMAYLIVKRSISVYFEEVLYYCGEESRVLKEREVACAVCHDKACIGDESFHCPGIAERCGGVLVAPEEQGRCFDIGHQVCQVFVYHL